MQLIKYYYISQQRADLSLLAAERSVPAREGPDGLCRRLRGKAMSAQSPSVEKVVLLTTDGFVLHI